MKRVPQVSHLQQWIFSDGSQPMQMRVMKAEEIGNQEHFHKLMVEYFYVIQGHMKLAVNDVQMDMQPDDLIVVEPGERHVVVEKSDDLILLLLMPPPVPDDKVLV